MKPTSASAAVMSVPEEEMMGSTVTSPSATLSSKTAWIYSAVISVVCDVPRACPPPSNAESAERKSPAVSSSEELSSPEMPPTMVVKGGAALLCEEVAEHGADEQKCREDEDHHVSRSAGLHACIACCARLACGRGNGLGDARVVDRFRNMGIGILRAKVGCTCASASRLAV